MVSGNVIISNCYNNGNISEGKSSGGVIGRAYNNVIILNCYNTEKISGGSSEGASGVGGIVGYGFNDLYIYNSYNIGNVETIKNAGGILGSFNWGNLHIENCLNVSNVVGDTVGGIGGKISSSHELLITKNCYYLNTNIINGFGNSNMEETEDINGITDTEIKSSEVLEKFNGYVNETKQIEGLELKKWTNGKDGYPTFE